MHLKVIHLHLVRYLLKQGPHVHCWMVRLNEQVAITFHQLVWPSISNRNSSMEKQCCASYDVVVPYQNVSQNPLSFWHVDRSPASVPAGQTHRRPSDANIHGGLPWLAHCFRFPSSCRWHERSCPISAYEPLLTKGWWQIGDALHPSRQSRISGVLFTRGLWLGLVKSFNF